MRNPERKKKVHANPTGACHVSKNCVLSTSVYVGVTRVMKYDHTDDSNGSNAI